MDHHWSRTFHIKLLEHKFTTFLAKQFNAYNYIINAAQNGSVADAILVLSPLGKRREGRRSSTSRAAVHHLRENKSEPQSSPSSHALQSSASSRVCPALQHYSIVQSFTPSLASFQVAPWVATIKMLSMLACSYKLPLLSASLLTDVCNLKASKLWYTAVKHNLTWSKVLQFATRD
jgi:hypothetical protein